MYSKLDTIPFIEKCFGDFQLSNSGLNVNVVCPICREKNGPLYEKKKLVIRSTDFTLHCWVCGYKSRNIFKLLLNYKRSLVSEYQEKFYKKESFHDIFGSSFHDKIESKLLGKTNQNKQKNSVVIDLAGFQILSKRLPVKKHMKASEQALNYLLESRKLTHEQIVSNSIGMIHSFSSEKDRYKFENRVIIPSINSNFEIDFFIGRSFLKTDKRAKYNNTPNNENIVFNELFLDHNISEYTLVEGPFDYICSPFKNTIPLFGSTISKKSKIFQMIFNNRPKILRIALDKEEVKKRELIAKSFSTLIDLGTKIIIAEIVHESAKDFAELQEQGVDKFSFIKEFEWHPKTKKEKICESILSKK